ncbi:MULTISPECIES: hypothetical protein [Deinococcus]|nr:hypothetical protein [Deinococcus gobiensis]
MNALQNGPTNQNPPHAERMPHSVTLPGDIEVCPFTPTEFFKKEYRLSRVDEDGHLYLALLKKGERRVVRGNRLLALEDAHYALRTGWSLHMIRLHVGDHCDYLVCDVEPILFEGDAERLSEQLRLADEEGTYQDAIAPFLAGLGRSLEAYFGGE